MVLCQVIFQDHLIESQVEIIIQGYVSYVSQTSGKMTGQVQQNMKTTNLEEFYRGSTKPTKTATQIQNNNMPSPSASLLKTSKINQQRHNEPQVSWKSEVSSMRSNCASI